MKIKYIILIIIFILASCSNKNKEPTIESKYIKAHNKILKKNYYEAALEFEELIEDYPFEELSIKGQIMASYAYYMQDQYDKTLEIIENFTALNPSHKNIDYLLYLKAISYYEQIPEIYRSQDMAKNSYFAFDNLIKRYPKSIYIKDAKQKKHQSYESIISGIIDKAKFKTKNHNYIGAINDYLSIISNYSDSKHVSQSYYRIIEIYINLGIKKEATLLVKQLNKKYPDDFWTKLAHKLNYS